MVRMFGMTWGVWNALAKRRKYRMQLGILDQPSFAGGDPPADVVCFAKLAFST
jgi:hypothetical protein